jgi:hypothetical protein
VQHPKIIYQRPTNLNAPRKPDTRLIGKSVNVVVSTLFPQPEETPQAPEWHKSRSLLSLAHSTLIPANRTHRPYTRSHSHHRTRSQYIPGPQPHPHTHGFILCRLHQMADGTYTPPHGPNHPQSWHTTYLNSESSRY